VAALGGEVGTLLVAAAVAAPSGLAPNRWVVVQQQSVQVVRLLVGLVEQQAEDGAARHHHASVRMQLVAVVPRPLLATSFRCRRLVVRLVWAL
jgi:hypothetical protein